MSEFFLKRYREICPDVVLVEPENLRTAIRVTENFDRLKKVLSDQNVKFEKIEWLKNGWWVQSKFSLGSTIEYLLGHYYLQAPLSQLTCEVLNPKPGSTVLDMASAPGSKTTYLAHLVKDGSVIALDVDASRLASVRNNAERMGLPNIVCVKKDARFASDLGQFFDYVMLDAPCSGNFCSDERWASRRTIDDIRKNARTQKELFKSAYRCLAPGGRMVYSTCSLEPEEDEMIISWALNRYDDLKAVDFDAPGDAGTVVWNGEQLNLELKKTKRFWPHKTGCEGFFIALLEKTSQ